jgi:bacillithiol system protein YtxJ
MNWKKLIAESQLEALVEESRQHPVLIFKHSTRCSISATALARLERNWKDNEVGDTTPYYLDLIANRALSGQVASQFDVAHQSPQVLLISKGECIYDASHFDISFEDIRRQLHGMNVE